MILVFLATAEADAERGNDQSVRQEMQDARTESPFTRASSAGLAGKRVIGCLRLEEPSFMSPRQPEQRSEPEGPRSRVPRGLLRGQGKLPP